MTESQPETPMGGCLLRMFWLIVGPAIVAVVGLILILHHPRPGSALDVVLLAATMAAVAARVLDRPKSGDEPGGLASSRPTGYVIGIVVAAVVLFVVGHFVAPRAF